MGRGDTFVNALIGVVVMILTSFTGIGPILGGAAAGYLQQEDSSAALRVGALSGLIAVIPIVLVMLTLGSTVPFLPTLGAPGAFAGLFIVGVLIVFVFAALYTIGLGALGGYIGWYVWKENIV